MATFKTNDNVEIYYEVHGEGRPLFMLPGWTCTTNFWRNNVPELSKTCKVICMDMRGHGQSENLRIGMQKREDGPGKHCDQHAGGKGKQYACDHAGADLAPQGRFLLCAVMEADQDPCPKADAIGK